MEEQMNRDYDKILLKKVSANTAVERKATISL